jgi:hypothetical protein
VSWLRRLLGSSPPPTTPREVDAVEVLDALASGEAGGAPDADDLHADSVLFVCSTCGRTDLPEAGGWDPPICLECDAAINFDAIEEVEITEDW